MPKQPQKVYETWQLRRFMENYNLFPRGDIIPTEEPDFLIKTQQVCVGIELTNFYRTVNSGKRPLQEQESLRDLLIERAKYLYIKHNESPLNVHVFFNHTVPFKKTNIPRLAEKISSICMDFNVSKSKELRRISHQDVNGFPVEISCILVSPSSHDFWVAQPGADLTPKCTTTAIQNRIDDKNAKVLKYLEKCDTIWLIIFADETKLSSTTDIPTEVQGHAYQSKFDRIFIFRNFDSHIIELHSRK